jgi:hypothetical protein
VLHGVSMYGLTYSVSFILSFPCVRQILCVKGTSISEELEMQEYQKNKVSSKS